MSSVSIRLGKVCAAGNHATIRAAVDGGPTVTLDVSADEIRQPLTQDEIDTALIAILKLAAKGLNKQQYGLKLTTGFTVVF